MNNDLTSNLEKLRITPQGAARVRKNLRLEAADVVQWCREAIARAEAIERKGKNWYARSKGCVITVNANSFTVITAHRSAFRRDAANKAKGRNWAEQQKLLRVLTAQSSLAQVQAYIQKVTELRGFAGQPVQETMLLLLEETGELAKAIRKAATHMSVDADKIHRYSTVESEVADVFFVLAAVCNQCGVDLFSALKEKEAVNCTRNWSFER